MASNKFEAALKQREAVEKKENKRERASEPNIHQYCGLLLGVYRVFCGPSLELEGSRLLELDEGGSTAPFPHRHTQNFHGESSNRVLCPPKKKRGRRKSGITIKERVEVNNCRAVRVSQIVPC